MSRTKERVKKLNNALTDVPGIRDGQSAVEAARAGHRFGGDRRGGGAVDLSLPERRRRADRRDTKELCAARDV